MLLEDVSSFEATASAVAFPLGGIGTGNVSLGARGDLRDWEIFNRPAKGNALPNSFFSLWVKQDGLEAKARIVEGPIQPPYDLSHGFHPVQNAGLPRFAKTTFHGAYPLAAIDFEDPDMPVSVRLEAFTPLIPLNPEDSGIPCALLSYRIANTSDETVKLTLVGSLTNPVGGLQRDPYGSLASTGKGKSVNEFRDDGTFRGLLLHNHGIEATDLDYGSLCLVTDHRDLTVKPVWRRGAWFDFLREFWDDLFSDGLLNDLGYDDPPDNGRPDTGSLGLIDSLEPGEHRCYRFVLCWHFPNRLNSWQHSSEKTIRNHYATRFDSAWSVAQYVMQHGSQLEKATRTFHEALFSTSLPPYVLDAISANIVTLRSNTCFWLEDGNFYGWEGCFDDAGCCPGTCTHVWSYAQTLAFLFPSLERVMRSIEFQIETEDDGYMSFRNFKTFDELFVWNEADQKPEAAVDGQMGSILRAYREWQLSGDREWLIPLWPAIKRALAFAGEQWDSDDDHVLDGRQHNTYDIEFYGPNPLSSIYYLAALRAGEELASVLGERATAETYRHAFELGSKNLDAMLWNGEYYVQRLDDVDEHMYQHGEGCLSDQLLGQLHARILDLGQLLPMGHVKSAIKAVFEHNFRPDLRGHVNAQRTYALPGEAGLLLCSWPNGGQPRFPFVYSDEVWTGIEYQVAAHLIYEGWLEQGLTLVKATRERHDGVKRNPWNEAECGHHYARSMASWALLLALSGFHCDLGRGEMRFEPVLAASTEEDGFTSFWSTGRGWGVYRQSRDPEGNWKPEVEVLGGDMAGVRVKACQQEWTL